MLEKTMFFYGIGLLTMVVGIEWAASTLTMAYLGSTRALENYSLAVGMLIILCSLISFRQAGKCFQKVRILEPSLLQALN